MNGIKLKLIKILKQSEQTTKNIPNLNATEVKYLDNDGIVKVGTFVKPGDILVGKSYIK